MIAYLHSNKLNICVNANTEREKTFHTFSDIFINFHHTGAESSTSTFSRAFLFPFTATRCLSTYTLSLQQVIIHHPNFVYNAAPEKAYKLLVNKQISRCNNYETVCNCKLAIKTSDSFVNFGFC